MFVPQAGKTVFNQSTLILIIRVSFAVWRPRFETEETKNKHAAPGKENTHEFAPLCLSVSVGPTFVVPTPTHPRAETHRSLTHPHKHIRYGKKIPLILFARFTRFAKRLREIKTNGCKKPYYHW